LISKGVLYARLSSFFLLISIGYFLPG